MNVDHITRAFETLAALPAPEAGFLRRLLFQALDEPELAINPALPEHLLLVPEVVRELPLEVVRGICARRPGMEVLASHALDGIAAAVADRNGVSADTLTRLCQVSLRDAPFLNNFLENRPVSEFL